MRTLVLILAFLVTAPAFAQTCPDLTGAYLCKQNSYRKDTHYFFDRKFVEGHWHYAIAAETPQGQLLSTFELIADGIEREITDLITGQVLTAKAFCGANILDVSGSAKGPNGQTIKFLERLKVDRNHDLVNTSLDIHGNLVTETCTRIP